MEKAKPTENLVQRRGSGRTRPDLRQTYRSQGTNDPVNIVSISFSANWTSRGRERDARQVDSSFWFYPILFLLLWRSFNFFFFCDQLQSHCHNRFSAKEGAKRVDQARPRTNIQVAHCTGPPIVISNQLAQTLDGKFGDGKSEAHGKYSAKEGVRPNGPARPQTHMQVICFKSYFLENLSWWYSLMAEQREKVKQGTGWQILSLNASTRLIATGSVLKKELKDLNKPDQEQTSRCIFTHSVQTNFWRRRLGPRWKVWGGKKWGPWEI